MNKVVKGHTVFFSVAIFASVAAGCVIGRASAGPPHMRAAMEALNTAHEELAEAAADKGGHRVNALRLVDEAREEVRAGMEYARENH
jgi:hypothetical protein